MKDLAPIVGCFPEVGRVEEIVPLTSGLINETYLLRTGPEEENDYVLQRINDRVFRDVELLQRNIDTVTSHLRRKLEERGVPDIGRKVLRFLKTREGKSYCFDGESYWRISVFIARSQTLEVTDNRSAYLTGLMFGEYQALLSDLPCQLPETIPDFHNMEFRLRQLREAVRDNVAGRLEEVSDLLDGLEVHASQMCIAEMLYREGRLPKRVCHCDTKLGNILFDEQGTPLCVIDLDTTMSSFVFSDFGDFLRSAANVAGREDEPDLQKVRFDMEVFRQFCSGYLAKARQFLSPMEIELLPFAATLFPYMQAVRFLTDYLNGDTYYRTAYDGQNLVRAKAQYQLFLEARACMPLMRRHIGDCI